MSYDCIDGNMGASAFYSGIVGMAVLALAFPNFNIVHSNIYMCTTCLHFASLPQMYALCLFPVNQPCSQLSIPSTSSYRRSN